MNKLITQIIAAIFTFFVLWSGLSQIDWLSILKINHITHSTEEKLGELYWDFIKQTEAELPQDSLNTPIDSIIQKVCDKNNIDKNQIKFHLLQKDEVNAFALPNNQLIIFSGLISSCESADELTGVICHELAHMEKKHVMRKLIKEVGLSALLTITTGQKQGEVIRQTAKLLSSTAYDRTLEREADLTAVDYLINAQVNPEPFANFLFRLSQNEKIPKQMYWISTHPDSEQRSVEITNKIKDQQQKYLPIIHEKTWKKLKNDLTALSDEY